MMADDLTERLNHIVTKAWAHGWLKGQVQRDVADAVARIEELEAENEELREKVERLRIDGVGFEDALAKRFMDGYKVGVKEGFIQ